MALHPWDLTGAGPTYGATPMVMTCQRCGHERPAVYLVRDQFWCAACLQEIGLPPDSAGGLRQAPSPCLGTLEEVATECQHRRERLALLVSTRGRADGFTSTLADLWAAMWQLDLGAPPAWPGEPKDALEALAMLDAGSQWCASKKGGAGAPPAAGVALAALDFQILQRLEANVPVLVNQIELEADERIEGGRGAIGAALKRLERAGLVHRPQGPRKGYTLTPLGRSYTTGH
jgi:hypothetical protein